MKFIKQAISLALLTVSTASAFVVQPQTQSQMSRSSSNLFMSQPPMPDPERMKQIMDEEARNPDNMKASAQMLKNLKPEDIDGMLREIDNMPAAQKKTLEAMGMNPDMMRQSMEMMKTNPQMAGQMASMMENMTPEEMMEKSRQAQANFAGGMPTTPPPATPAVVEAEVVNEEEEEEEDEEDSDPIPPPEKEILDNLYRTAEIMSDPPTGKVTFAGFSTIPPVALLSGNDEEDLSKKELKECWADGSLGSSRVDRVGFERVWVEVQEYFSLPMMENSRERTQTKKRVAEIPKPAAATVVTPSSPVGGLKVGEDIPSEMLEEQMKNMSDSDMNMMLKQMQELTPEQEARMKAMGVDPRMMQKTASMMNSNPLMKGAAKMMMKNMSADQMKQASQQAQDQMSKMTTEEIEKQFEDLQRQSKQQ
mmetsp:Transcript_20798/g.30744  ORF Transcript_20798/g.30744 Transcript_20798/m.30744 type:complete len:421 (-) Transcript_20798:47-1309(-)